MWGEITRGVSVHGHGDRRRRSTSPLAVREWPVGHRGIHDERDPGRRAQTQTAWLKYRGEEWYAPPLDGVLQPYAHARTARSRIASTSTTTTVNGIALGLQTCAHTAARSYHPGGVNRLVLPTVRSGSSRTRSTPSRGSPSGRSPAARSSAAMLIDPPQIRAVATTMSRRIGWNVAWIVLVALAGCDSNVATRPIERVPDGGPQAAGGRGALPLIPGDGQEAPGRSRTSINSATPGPGAPTVRSAAARSSCDGRRPSPTPTWSPPRPSRTRCSPTGRPSPRKAARC